MLSIAIVALAIVAVSPVHSAPVTTSAPNGGTDANGVNPDQSNCLAAAKNDADVFACLGIPASTQSPLSLEAREPFIRLTTPDQQACLSSARTAAAIDQCLGTQTSILPQTKGFASRSVLPLVPLDHGPVVTNRFPARPGPHNGLAVPHSSVSVLPGPLRERDFVQFLARASEDESGASIISTAISAAKKLIGPLKTVANVGETVLNGGQAIDTAQQLLDPPVPAPSSTSVSAPTVPVVGSLPIQQRQIFELLARADEDESGASLLSTVKGLFHDAGKLTKSASAASAASTVVQLGNALTPPPPPPAAQQQVAAQRRELVELLARAAADDDESGASIISTIINAAKKFTKVGETVLNGSQGIDTTQQILDPPAPAPSSTSVSAPTVPVVGSLPIQRRDSIELLERADENESGASVLSAVKGFLNDAEKLEKLATAASAANTAIQVAHALNPPPPPAQQQAAAQRRELVELLARAAAADDDESGASILSAIGKIFKDPEVAKFVKTAATTSGIISDGVGIAAGLKSALSPLPAQSATPATPSANQQQRRGTSRRSLNDLD